MYYSFEDRDQIAQKLQCTYVYELHGPYARGRRWCPGPTSMVVEDEGLFYVVECRWSKTMGRWCAYEKPHAKLKKLKGTVIGVAVW